jgi:hypothetical protein
MTVDEVNGIDREPSNDDRMAVMHRLLNLVERDEDRARRKLYGSSLRSGPVTPLGTDHPPVNSDDAPAGIGRVA